VPHQLSPVTPLGDTGTVNVDMPHKPHRGAVWHRPLLSVLVRLGTFEKINLEG
jgi:hypothetical protein